MTEAIGMSRFRISVMEARSVWPRKQKISLVLLTNEIMQICGQEILKAVCGHFCSSEQSISKERCLCQLLKQ